MAFFVKKLKKVKLKYHREIPTNYRIKSVTLTNSNGNYREIKESRVGTARRAW